MQFRILVFSCLLFFIFCSTAMASEGVSVPKEVFYPLVVLLVGWLGKEGHGAYSYWKELRITKSIRKSGGFNGNNTSLSLLEKMSKMENTLETVQQKVVTMSSQVNDTRDDQKGSQRILSEILDELRESRVFSQGLLQTLVEKVIE